MNRLVALALFSALACGGPSISSGPGGPGPSGPECQNASDCDDQDACNGYETCSNGLCVAGSNRVSCNDGDRCTDDYCNPDDGSCSNDEIADCDPDADGDGADDETCEPGEDIDDDLACNGRELCDAEGLVVESTAIDCDDDDPCTEDTCVEPTGRCQNVPIEDCDPDAVEHSDVAAIERCDNEVDDDDDELVDCDDDACSDKPWCNGETVDGEDDEDDEEIDDDREPGERCHDREDNDGDFAVDCYDFDCEDDPDC